MDQTEDDSVNFKYQNIPSNSATNALNPMQCFLLWEDENSASFMCKVCRKTFYNELALQNHTNMQHDTGDLKKVAQPSKRYFDQNLNDLCGFKFIPLKKNIDTNDGAVHGGLVSRVFSEDTTYLIVKVEGTSANIASLKRCYLNGAKRTQGKPGKPPVDLRGPFTCTFPSTLLPDLQCRQIFFSCCDYSLHYREEHTKRRKAALRCQVCEKRLDRDLFHQSTYTPPSQAINSFDFSCPPCEQRFLETAKFNDNNLVQAKTKPHQCSICTKRFTQQGGLQQHMRMHTGIRPFACTFCPKAFTQKAGLDQHLRTHTKIKPFKCVICSKCFSQSVHLRQHMRTHTNIQPFQCSVCGRRFKQSSHLNFHMRSHLGETGPLVVEQYAQAIQNQNHMEFLNLSNFKPVQDGETLYYAAELAVGPPTNQNPFPYSSQVVLASDVLPL